MKILHLEASPGWGGQEIRSLREAEGLRSRGHQILFAVQCAGGLVSAARQSGFSVLELPFSWSQGIKVVSRLIHYVNKEQVDLIVTHSSLDAWLGGIAARCCGVPVIRIRHLSTPIAKGLNSWLLYRMLADRVITTCAEIVPRLQRQAGLSLHRCVSIPTGVSVPRPDPNRVEAFRKQYRIKPNEIIVGTTCVLRGWKGIEHLIEAAHVLAEKKDIRWLIVGDGPSASHFHRLVEQYALQDRVLFTGHLEDPLAAMALMDIFCLVSYAHEGVSQAVLQAAALSKPLITTSIGGLKEVCIPRVTGLIVPPKDPTSIAKAVLSLVENPEQRIQYGEEAKSFVMTHFNYERMLDQIESMITDSIHESHFSFPKWDRT